VAVSRVGGTEPGRHAFCPTWVGEVELARPLGDLVPPPGPSGRPYERALLLVRLHSQTVCTVTVDLEGGQLPAGDLAHRIFDACGPAINEHLVAGGIAAVDGIDAGGLSRPLPTRCDEAPDDELPFASIIVCTRDRPELVVACLRRLADMDYPRFEVVLVDNAPTSTATADVVGERFGQDPRIRYVLDDQPGLSHARNRGVRAARGEILAFTDDDNWADRRWLRSLVRGFARDGGVACVTGLILPARLDTRAQARFEEAMAAETKWGFRPKVFDLSEPPSPHPLYPYQLGAYGAGGNMAFRKEFLLSSGGFDETLGAGSPSSGGEDLDAFLRVVTSGRRLAYEPAAVVWHAHPRDDRAMRKQAFGYGVGLGATLSKLLLDGTHRRQLVARGPRGIRYLFGRSSDKNSVKLQDFPLTLTTLELLGLLWGPVALRHSRRVVEARASGPNGSSGAGLLTAGAERPTSSGEVPSSGSFRPVKVLEVELGAPLPAVHGGVSSTGTDYGSAFVLVRLHGQPVGAVEVGLPGGTLAAEPLAAAVQGELGDAIARHLRDDGLPADPDSPAVAAGAHAARCLQRLALDDEASLVSVVIATCRRPEQLTRCLDSILASDRHNLEVLVVDNSPADPRTRALIEEDYPGEGVRYVAEWKVGTSAARNTGLALARGDIVMFADDDIVVDRQWIRAHVATLIENPDAVCSTGLTLPYRLDAPSQVWFEQYGGFGLGYEELEFHVDMEPRPSLLYPYTPGVGGGANMAIRRSVGAALGGFDTRLGPGTPTTGGEDLDLFIRLLLAGNRIVYTPRALAWHEHRIHEGDLFNQAFGYGAGSCAVLTKWCLRRSELPARIVLGAGRLHRAFGPKQPRFASQTSPPHIVLAAQLAGAASGPFLWLRSTYNNRRAA
jgi:GT2 family glycosyltransferase